MIRQQSQGKLIAFEGIDGSGKETQAKLLIKKLKKAGAKTALFSFPDYETRTGKEIKKKIHNLIVVNQDPQKTELYKLYEQNRAEKKKAIEENLKKNYIVVCDRYEPSNEAYQSALLLEKEQEKFILQIRNYSFNVCKNPKPDIIIFIDLKPKLAEILKKNRKEQDAYEKNLPFLRRVYSRYQKIAKSKNWTVIKCFDKDKILPPSEIAEKVWHELSSVL